MKTFKIRVKINLWLHIPINLQYWQILLICYSISFDVSYLYILLVWLNRFFLFKILRQGPSPLSYLDDSIKKYISCVQNRQEKGCDEVMEPPAPKPRKSQRRDVFADAGMSPWVVWQWPRKSLIVWHIFSIVPRNNITVFRGYWKVGNKFVRRDIIPLIKYSHDFFVWLHPTISGYRYSLFCIDTIADEKNADRKNCAWGIYLKLVHVMTKKIVLTASKCSWNSVANTLMPE